MTWSDFFASQTFGVIIGSLLTAGFTWFIEWRKAATEQKFHIREKREETYLKILSIYYTQRQEQNVPVKKIISQLPIMIEKIYPAINVWGSKKVKSIYDKVMKSKDNQEELLIKTIREELGIKD